MSQDSRAYDIPSIVQLLNVHNNGDDAARITEQYHELVNQCSDLVAEHGGTAKGKLTVTFEVIADQKGLDLAIVPKLSLPGPPKIKSRYFPTRDRRGLTLMDPARDTMFPGANLGRRGIAAGLPNGD
jgi:hypothetical protein